MFGQTNTRRTRRTPEQIRDDLKNQLKNQDVKIALNKAQDDEILKPVFERLAEVKRSAQMANLGLKGTAQQKFANRRRKHELWIDEIEALENYATALSKVSEKAIDEYQDILDQGASMIVEGRDRKEIQEQVTEALGAINAETEEIRNLREIAEKASQARADFSASLESDDSTENQEAGNDSEGNEDSEG